MRTATLICLLAACNQGNIRGRSTSTFSPSMCEFDREPDAVVPSDACAAYEVGNFKPKRQWMAGMGQSCRSTPIVADLDGDGVPEVLVTLSSQLGRAASLLVLNGADGSVKWRNNDANLAYASSVGVADLDEDGSPEIIGVRQLGPNRIIPPGPFTVVAWTADGEELWESEEFQKQDMDHAAAVAIHDMDRDGRPEIIVGRVVLNANGTTRARGSRGRGSYGGPANVAEAAIPAVMDLNGDGLSYVVVGNARYNLAGNAVQQSGRTDGLAAIADLTGDGLGDVVITSTGTVRAESHAGALLWGPIEIEGATHVSPPTIADLSGDGRPNIIAASGDQLVVLHADGTEYWSAPVQDLTGMAGMTVFDFEGDGIPEVVYADEVSLYAFDGRTGEIKFQTDEHFSLTMAEYPVVADIDGDGQAEVLVCHEGGFRRPAITAFAADEGHWAPARKLWNQHAYWRDHINDDLTVPAEAESTFSTHNSFRSAWDEELIADGTGVDVSLVPVGKCEEYCIDGLVHVAVWIANAGPDAVEDGVPVQAFADFGGSLRPLGAVSSVDPIDRRSASEAVIFEFELRDVGGADAIVLQLDAAGVDKHCGEASSEVRIPGPFCD